MNPIEFQRKWIGVELNVRAAAQEHLLDLCRVLGHQTPAEMDREGTTFTFERGAAKSIGGEGWADVWYRGHFAWEYKGRRANLKAAYDQLNLYRESLENPPLLIVSDLNKIEIHTNFTGTVKARVPLQSGRPGPARAPECAAGGLHQPRIPEAGDHGAGGPRGGRRPLRHDRWRLACAWR